ncbi:hypothetical protein FA95DRAFT_1557445 [Auriscalpium vulgare]|uniref:Uncharacterized protein n=1 Tax=Auriscalpium vulgare TaxID=40419 RepID=A0ACB8RZ23_9AGAM|nr:hypothetical protein FA95DRAFT_1557445 [Auriscalpium vulgare]
MSAEASTFPTTTEPDGPAITDVESPDLWFNDGSIVIRSIADTSTTPPTRALYKLHKSLLAKNCSVFAALFDGPQDAFAAGSEQHDGLPIMELPDNPEELRNFLRVLYIPGEIHTHRRLESSRDPGEAAWEVFPASYYGILRLAFKYDAGDIMDLILLLLKDQWPPKLAAWDRLYMDTEFGNYKFGNYADPVLAIQLGVECNIPDILPQAYYSLACRLAVTRNPTKRAALLARVTTHDLRTVYLGQLSIGDGLHVLVDLSQSIPDCGKSVSSCSCGETIIKMLESYAVRSGLSDDPLRFLGVAIDHLPNTACPACRARAKKALLAKREAFWRSLPSFFALESRVSPTWGEEEKT